MTVKLTQEDYVKVKEMYEIITSAMFNARDELKRSERYGAWSVMALMNVVCKLLKYMNFDKEKAYELLCQVWDGRHNSILN